MNRIVENKYLLRSARLSSWDYGSNGKYYVTICTDRKIPYFGHMEIKGLVPTLIGDYTKHCWESLPEHHPFVELDSFTLMPNHLHGILYIRKKDQKARDLNHFGSQSRNLATVVDSFKSLVELYAETQSIDFEWQARYSNRIIRNDRELNHIRDYIRNIPRQWFINNL